MGAKERIREFIDYKKISINAFEDMVGLSNGTIGKKGEIQTRSLNNIHQKFPELNLNWVVTGEGNMLNPGRETPMLYAIKSIPGDIQLPGEMEGYPVYLTDSPDAHIYTNDLLKTDVQSIIKGISDIKTILEKRNPTDTP